MGNVLDITFLKSKKGFIKKYGHTDSFLLLDPDPATRYCFVSQQVEGFLGFGISMGTAIVLGGLICAPEDRGILLNEFKDFCSSRFKRIFFFNVYEDVAFLLKEAGFEITYIGDDALIPLETFDVKGVKKRNLRHTASIARRYYTVREVCGRKEIEDIYPQLLEIEKEFLERKVTGKMGFFTGNLNLDNLEDKRLFVAENSKGIAGYVFCFPMYPGNNYRPELFRRRFNTIGVNELILLHIIDQFKKEGISLFTLGLSPAVRTHTDSIEDYTLFRASLLTIARYLNFLIRFLPGASGFKTLQEFKNKFRPDWTKCYYATYPRLSIISMIACLKTWGFFKIRIFYILKMLASKSVSFTVKK